MAEGYDEKNRSHECWEVELLNSMQKKNCILLHETNKIILYIYWTINRSSKVLCVLQYKFLC